MLNRRLILDYAALVGVPFLGLLGVLHVGDRVPAPLSLEGKWSLEADLGANRSSPCSTRLGNFREPAIQISQSGMFVEITLPNTLGDRLAGRFEHGEVIAEAEPALFGGDVFDVLRVSAKFCAGGGEPELRGVLAMPRHIECAPMPFIARRAPNE
jgi:hypothetical protein